jgi:drug/metabolite transporter (DMT)-like permease
MPTQRHRTAAMAALLAGACCIGFAPILVRLTETGPAAAGFWRLLLALPMMAPFAFRAGPEGEPALLPSWPMILAGLFFSADLTFWHYGIALTSVANATVLANLTPIVVTAVGWVIFKERPARLFLLGLGLGLAGAWTMASAHGGHAPVGKNPLLGDLLSAGTAVWYAFYFLAVRRARSTRSTMSIMFWSSAVGVVGTGAVMLAFGEPVIPRSLAGWGACLGLAVVHVTGQGAIAWALGRLPTATASVVVLIQPVVAGLLGWILFHEALGAWQGVGAVAVLAGVALAQWAARPASGADAALATGADS